MFRRHIVAQTRTRLYAFVHIANIGLAGFPVPELFNLSYAQRQPGFVCRVAGKPGTAQESCVNASPANACSTTMPRSCRSLSRRSRILLNRRSRSRSRNQ